MMWAPEPRPLTRSATSFLAISVAAKLILRFAGFYFFGQPGIGVSKVYVSPPSAIDIRPGAQLWIVSA